MEENPNQENEEIKEEKPQKIKKWLTIIIIVAVVVIAIIIIKYPTTAQNIDCDATCCIGENSVIVALKSCGACNKQKELFGDSAEDLNIVYCEDDNQFCIDNDIRSVPTWIINNEKYVGVQSIDKLKELTGC